MKQLNCLPWHDRWHICTSTENVKIAEESAGSAEPSWRNIIRTYIPAMQLKQVYSVKRYHSTEKKYPVLQIC